MTQVLSDITNSRNLLIWNYSDKLPELCLPVCQNTYPETQLSDFISLSQSMTKPTKWPVCPAKTQDQQPRHLLGPIRVFGVRTKKHWVLRLETHRVPSEDSSDWVGAQAHLSLHRAHRSFFFSCCGSVKKLLQEKSKSASCIFLWSVTCAILNRHL